MEKDLAVLFEDDFLMVINKPSGLTVNKSDTTTGETTVQDWAEKYLKVSKVSVPNVSQGGVREYPSEFYTRGGIVHRLDKETSGALIIGKTTESFDNLQKQFRERLVKKTYIALAHGNITPPEGEINVPVGRLPWNRKQFGVVAGGREARTKYRVLSVLSFQLSDKGQSVVGFPVNVTERLKTDKQSSENRKPKTDYGKTELLSLVELYPETGRTHQIRVHLKHIGHPIFSDFLYAGRKTARNDRKHLERVFLHAPKISFLHPTTGESLTLEAPLPKELSDFLSTYCEKSEI